MRSEGAASEAMHASGESDVNQVELLTSLCFVLKSISRCFVVFFRSCAAKLLYSNATVKCKLLPMPSSSYSTKKFLCKVTNFTVGFCPLSTWRTSVWLTFGRCCAMFWLRKSEAPLYAFDVQKLPFVVATSHRNPQSFVHWLASIGFGRLPPFNFASFCAYHFLNSYFINLFPSLSFWVCLPTASCKAAVLARKQEASRHSFIVHFDAQMYACWNVE